VPGIRYADQCSELLALRSIRTVTGDCDTAAACRLGCAAPGVRASGLPGGHCIETASCAARAVNDVERLLSELADDFVLKLISMCIQVVNEHFTYVQVPLLVEMPQRMNLRGMCSRPGGVQVSFMPLPGWLAGACLLPSIASCTRACTSPCCFLLACVEATRLRCVLASSHVNPKMSPAD
jgi:hypothetical protein